LQRPLCHAILFGGCLLRAAFYQARGVLQNHEIDRTRARASWCAFKALIQRQACGC
jgi:hypothetical protein